jgi:hypothetical protein
MKSWFFTYGEVRGGEHVMWLSVHLNTLRRIVEYSILNYCCLGFTGSGDRLYETRLVCTQFLDLQESTPTVQMSADQPNNPLFTARSGNFKVKRPLLRYISLPITSQTHPRPISLSDWTLSPQST